MSVLEKTNKEKLLKEIFYKGDPNFKGPVLFGTNNNNLEKCYDFLKKGIDFVYLDMPYFKNTRIHFTKDLTKSQFRVLYNNIQINKIFDVPSDRFMNINLKIKDWINIHDKKYKDIIFFASSSSVTNFYCNNKKVEEILAKTAKKFPNLKIKISKKISSKFVAEMESVENQTKDALFTISLTSTAPIESILNGIPNFCFKESCCYPVSGDWENINNIDSIILSDKRKEWASTLAYSQFSLKEIEKGMPKYIFKNYFKIL